MLIDGYKFAKKLLCCQKNNFAGSKVHAEFRYEKN